MDAMERAGDKPRPATCHCQMATGVPGT
jgi:hypothetical protein